MYEYDYDAEAEIVRLKSEVSKEEARTIECQKEINRLRNVVRYYLRVQEAITEPDYKKLFEAWGDFDDKESSPAVIAKSEELGPVDAVSFMAYCAGFAQAAELFKED